MNKDKFFELLKQDFSVNEQMIQQFDLYKKILQEQNTIHNLTNLDKDELIWEKYFYDSIIPYKEFDFNHLKVLDIGSGSGIPGIVLKILFPTMQLDIIEANGKKANFMNLLVDKLQLKDVNIFNQRAEEIKDYQKNQYDVVTSRAVANLKILIEISTPYLKLNGVLIEPKSINYMNEYEEAKPLIDDIGLELISIKEYNTNQKHNIFYFKKTKPTPNKYPRTWREIIK